MGLNVVFIGFLRHLCSLDIIIINNNNMFIRTKIQGIKVHIMTFKYTKAIILYK